MTIKLRDYQQDVELRLYDAWRHSNNQLTVMPCGSGKTVLFSKVVHDFDGAAALIVHRQELVSQISLTLAAFGIRHDVIAPKNVVSMIRRAHVKKFGQSFVSSRSNKKVGGVDTLIRRKDHDFDKWRKKVGLWVQDEAHHVLKENKWGKAVDLFTGTVYGLGVTATPVRADGKGLGYHHDGVFHNIVEGPTLRWMIDQGYLVDYKVFAPPSDIDFSGLKPTSSGDYSTKKLREREKNSHIFGDVVDHFNRIASGKQGITFASNIKSAIEFANMFNQRGVNAKMICGDTKDSERSHIDEKFRLGDVRQMTNVDLFGEGYDIPILDCVTMARKTESFGLFVQQATRPLRPSYTEGMPLDTREQRLASIAASSKPVAYIIDHVGNVQRHAVCINGVIDLCYADWSLDRRDKRKKNDTLVEDIPIKVCGNCANSYGGLETSCPYCGDKPKPTQRKEPKQVDGDLTELDPSSLRQIKQQIEEVRKPYKPKALSRYTAEHMRKHDLKLSVLDSVRNSIAEWAGYWRSQGDDDQRICKRFFYNFNVDLMTWELLNTKDAKKLKERIDHAIKTIT